MSRFVMEGEMLHTEYGLRLLSSWWTILSGLICLAAITPAVSLLELVFDSLLLEACGLFRSLTSISKLLVFVLAFAMFFGEI